MRARIVSDSRGRRQRRIRELGTGFPDSFPRFLSSPEQSGGTLQSNVVSTNDGKASAAGANENSPARSVASAGMLTIKG